MIAAGRAAELGKKVLLLERNNVLGVKLRITGNGRCNLTNMVPLEHFSEYYTDNPKFLHNAFGQFFNQELIDLLHKYGLRVKVEHNNRVFPVSDKSGDVVRALELYMQKGRVEVKCRTLVMDIIMEQNKVTGIRTKEGMVIPAARVIIATGGKSYPHLGSNGSGYQWAKKFGHNVARLRPGLVAIEIKEPWIRKLQGLSVKDAAIYLYADDKMKKKIIGDIVFAHYGISGPGAFDLSMYIPELPDKTKMVIKLDIFANVGQEQLTAEIDNIIEDKPRLKCKNITFENIPRKILNLYLELAGIDSDKSLGQLQKKEKMHLINIFKGVQFTVQRIKPLKEAMVTRGGVSTKELNPKTMESKIIRGLYFCGEVLDIAGISGGFNLQAAFSTGYLAGTNSAHM